MDDILAAEAAAASRRKEDVHVDLKKTDAAQSYGFVFATLLGNEYSLPNNVKPGATQDTAATQVTEVLAGGLAEGKLHPEDVLVSVNNTLVAGLGHDACVEMIKAMPVGDTLNLVVQRLTKLPLPYTTSVAAPAKVVTLELKRDAPGQAFGFSFRTDEATNIHEVQR